MTGSIGGVTPAAPVYSHLIDSGMRQEVSASSWAPTHHSRRGTSKEAISKYPAQAAEVQLDQLVQAPKELTKANAEQVAHQIADQAGPQEAKLSQASGRREDSTFSATTQLAEANLKAPYKAPSSLLVTPKTYGGTFK